MAEIDNKLLVQNLVKSHVSVCEHLASTHCAVKPPWMDVRTHAIHALDIDKTLLVLRPILEQRQKVAKLLLSDDSDARIDDIQQLLKYTDSLICQVLCVETPKEL